MDSQPDLRHANILIVDDTESMRALVRRMLERMLLGQIAECIDGKAALEFMQVANIRIDLIICDWNMPEMSGLDFLKIVRARHPKMPFLMLTGRADLASVKAAATAGVSGYVIKPISPADLKAKVTILLQDARRKIAS